MQNSYLVDLIGGIFIVVAGTLLHFVYDWSHHNKYVGFFAPVNESTWEHLKLLIAPSLLWLVVEYFVYQDTPTLFLAHLIGLISGMIVIPLIFYTYKFIVGHDVLVLDILAFVIAVVAEQMIFHFLLQALPANDIVKNIGIFGLIVILIVYLTRTYVPAHNFLSRDPITGKFGISGHWDAEKKRKKKR